MNNDNKVDLNSLVKTLNKMNNKKKYKKYFFIFLSVILIVCIGFYSLNILNNLSDKKKIVDKEEEIREIVDVEEVTNVGEAINPPEDKTGLYWQFINYSMIDVDINKLKQSNSDTKGWLFVNNTNINYPVVQSTDNDFYLTHQFDKSYNSAGWVYMDYRNSNIMDNNRNTIIYGHGLKNRTIFGSLKNTLKSSWYNTNENLVIKTVDENSSYLWQVFSIYTIVTNNDYIQTDFFGDEEYVNFLNLISGRSIKNFNVPLTKDDKVLTLSTCYTDDKKLVVHAKMIKKS